MKSLVSRLLLLIIFFITTSAYLTISSTPPPLPYNSFAVTPLTYASIGGRQMNGLQLNVSLKEGKVLLDWTALASKQGTYFVVQRSQDGSSWRSLGGIVEHSTQPSLKSYTFKDEDVTASAYYYKLKQVGTDGNTSFSNTVFVNILSEDLLNIYPNPVVGHFQLNLPASPNHPLSMEITNIAGQRMIFKRYEPSDYNRLTNIDASDFPPALYLITVYANDQRLIKRLIKH